jgi:hypothetical protein
LNEKKEEKVIKIRDTGDSNSEEVIVTRSPPPPPPSDQQIKEHEETDKKEEKRGDRRSRNKLVKLLAILPPLSLLLPSFRHLR